MLAQKSSKTSQVIITETVQETPTSMITRLRRRRITAIGLKWSWRREEISLEEGEGSPGNCSIGLRSPAALKPQWVWELSCHREVGLRRDLAGWPRPKRYAWWCSSSMVLYQGPQVRMHNCQPRGLNNHLLIQPLPELKMTEIIHQ